MTGPRLGFDRDIRRAWLDAAAAIASQRLSSRETQVALMRELDGQVRGTTPQSGRGKTVTILRRIWFAVPPEVEPLRDGALAILTDGDADSRLALHWAMLLATHPFFADAAAVVGRLLALQGTFERAHVMRRLTERWGDRSTLARAVPRLLVSLTEWGVLTHVGEQFGPPPPRILSAPHAAILLEAGVMASPGRTASFQTLAGSPMVFPFDASGGIDQIRRSGRVRLHREGLDVEIVSLART